MRFRVRGRVETQALEHHETQPVHLPTPEEAELTRLNIALINTEDPAIRSKLTSAIYTTELRASPSALARQTIAHPVPLSTLQHDLSTNAAVIEYVLAEPASYALAVTHDSVSAYALPSKSLIEADANRYRKELRTQKEDKQLGQRLYHELLAPIQQYKQKKDLNDDGPFVAARGVTHTTSVAVSLQNLFSQASEILLVLASQGVADRTHPMRKNLASPALTMHRALSDPPHHIT